MVTVFPVAASVPFNDEIAQLGVDSTQEAIEALKTLIENQNQSYVVENRVVTALEITNKQLTLSFTPSSADTISFHIPCGTSQIYGQDYILTGSNILTWVDKGLETLLESGDNIIIIYIKQ